MASCARFSPEELNAWVSFLHAAVSPEQPSGGGYGSGYGGGGPGGFGYGGGKCGGSQLGGSAGAARWGADQQIREFSISHSRIFVLQVIRVPCSLCQHSGSSP